MVLSSPLSYRSVSIDLIIPFDKPKDRIKRRKTVQLFILFAKFKQTNLACIYVTLDVTFFAYTLPAFFYMEYSIHKVNLIDIMSMCYFFKCKGVGMSTWLDVDGTCSNDGRWMTVSCLTISKNMVRKNRIPKRTPFVCSVCSAVSCILCGAHVQKRKRGPGQWFHMGTSPLVRRITTVT